ncbi:MAG: ATPase, T2SS/T4P/T4SS family, partial [Pseudomonadota bacterium]
MVQQATRDSNQQQQQLSYYKALHDIANQIHAAKDINEILINLKDQMLGLFDADRITIYVVDGRKKEIYSRLKAGNIPEEIRVPVDNQSIAGYTAHNAEICNIGNAYDNLELSTISKELTFDKSWDEKFGYVTKQILALPILFQKYVIGVLQLINKKNGDKFSLEDQNSAAELASVLGIAFYNQRKLSQKGKKRTRFDYLINNDLITEKELEKAIAMAREQKTSIESIFINDMKVRKEEIGRSLGEYYNCDYALFDKNHPIPGDLLAKLKPAYLRANLWVPLGQEEGKVKILIDNPQRLDKIDSVKSLIPAVKYEFVVGMREDVLQFLDYFYGSAKGQESIDEILSKLDVEDEVETEGGAEMLTEDDSAIMQLVNKIITDAYKRKCSDIHIEPYPGKEGAEIRFRVDGICYKYQTVPYHYRRALSSRIKIMADLDISERRRPQDGKINFKRFAPLDIELRVATVPTVGGEEDVVMRILVAGEPILLDAVGMNERDHDL